MKKNLHHKTFIYLISIITSFLLTIVLPIVVVFKLELNIKIYYVILLSPITILMTIYLNKVLYSFIENRVN